MVVSFLKSGANTSASGINEEWLKAIEEHEERQPFKDNAVPQTAEKEQKGNPSGAGRFLSENTDNEDIDVFSDHKVYI